MVFTEDRIINGMLQSVPMRYTADGWAERLGCDAPAEPTNIGDWSHTFMLDYAAFKPYADAVFAGTDAYIACVPNEDLDRAVQSPIGEHTVGWALTTLLATHTPAHLGEIAALKGVHGLKGLPF